ncbi:flagellar hook-length control protein FliK [Clostridium taeniosporum]|uniref:Flagellar hook-length control protein FliK n=1 Tax=Clostridium taeniosporum TaxID=394958 RepID=A0A1D7XIC7_9CLOT|nr:flagellar hook-length control protein FliK [Clostridium taeniosporum]AOR22930.1 flagellar hook-length control protein FliK [Clostridium taeniosporum]
MKMKISSNLNLTSLNSEPKNIKSKFNSQSFDDKKDYSTTSKKDTSFKSALNEKSNKKVDDSSKSYDKDLDKKIQEKDKDVDIKKKINEIKEKSDNLSKDELVELLNSIFNMLSSAKDQNIDLKELNSDLLNSIIDKLGKEGSDLSKLLDNLLNASKNSLTELLSSDTKELLKNLLTKLEQKLDKDTDLSNKVKDLMSQISNNLESKENKTSDFNTSFKNFQQNANSSMSEKNTGEEKVGKNNASDEDAFLNKLLNNDKEDNTLNKINLVATRNEINANNVETTSETMTINKATMGEDLIRSVKFMMTNAMKELTVKIAPKHLGELTISLIQENGIMKANIKAHSKETLELLSQNLVEMKKAITDQNIKVADVNVELYQEDTTFFKDEGFGSGLAKDNEKQNSSNNKRTSHIDAIDIEDDATEILNSNLDFLA